MKRSGAKPGDCSKARSWPLAKRLSATGGTRFKCKETPPPAYLNYVVITDDGRSLTGMITSETATSVTLQRAEGETDTVLRTNIDELSNSGISIMPEGQEKLMTKQEMADVIAYLMSIE